MSASIAPLLLRGVAAVHRKSGAGDERGFVAGKEYSTPSFLLGLGASFEGSGIDERLQFFCRSDVEHRGEDDSRVDRVDADFVGRVFDGSGFGKQANSAL